jgi:hypothetical protein
MFKIHILRGCSSEVEHLTAKYIFFPLKYQTFTRVVFLSFKRIKQTFLFLITPFPCKIVINPVWNFPQSQHPPSLHYLKLLLRPSKNYKYLKFCKHCEFFKSLEIPDLHKRLFWKVSNKCLWVKCSVKGAHSNLSEQSYRCKALSITIFDAQLEKTNEQLPVFDSCFISLFNPQMTFIW